MNQVQKVKPSLKSVFILGMVSILWFVVGFAIIIIGVGGDIWYDLNNPHNYSHDSIPGTVHLTPGKYAVYFCIDSAKENYGYDDIAAVAAAANVTAADSYGKLITFSTPNSFDQYHNFDGDYEVYAIKLFTISTEGDYNFTGVGDRSPTQWFSVYKHDKPSLSPYSAINSGLIIIGISVIGFFAGFIIIMVLRSSNRKKLSKMIYLGNNGETKNL